jgi:hypothetical protein
MELVEFDSGEHQRGFERRRTDTQLERVAALAHPDCAESPCFDCAKIAGWLKLLIKHEDDGEGME